MKTLEITKRMYQAGTAYEGWADEEGFGRIGGPYAELLCASCDEDDPISLVSLVGNRPVGQINLLKGAVVLRGASVPVYWGSGFAVPSEHRSTGAGLALMARLRSMRLASGAVSISQLALPLYTKLGWQCLGARRYLLMARPSAYLEHRFGLSVPVRLAAWLADQAAHVYRQLVRLVLKTRTPHFQTEVISQPADIREDWFTSHTDRPFTTARTAGWLRRVMELGPKDNSRQLHVVRGPHQRVLGYFVTSVAMREGIGNGRFGNLMVASLRDWVSFAQDVLTEQEVMLMGLSELLKASCDVIELCIPNGQASTVPRRLGMVTMGELHFALRLPPDMKGHHPDLADAERWWFRPGDGDAFLL